MKYAVIADIHANLTALKTLLDDSKLQECDALVCLGDVVGEYGSPNECVETVRNFVTCCVKGNVDEYCSSEISLNSFSRNAAETTERTETWPQNHGRSAAMQLRI